MVCSRANLCNNWCIFWLSETTKTPLCFALYTQGILFGQTLFREFTNVIETDWDTFETITIKCLCSNILCAGKSWKFENYFCHYSGPEQSDVREPPPVLHSTWRHHGRRRDPQLRPDDLLDGQVVLSSKQQDRRS